MKYKQREQKGELAYGQPTFGINLKSDETPKRVAFGYDFVFATHKIQNIVKNLTTGEEKIYEYEKDYKCDAVNVLEVDKKYKKQALRQGFEVLKEKESTITIKPPFMHLDKVLKCNRKPVPILKSYYIALVSPQSFIEATCCAEYFDQRLPQEFFDKYLGWAFDLN